MINRVFDSKNIEKIMDGSKIVQGLDESGLKQLLIENVNNPNTFVISDIENEEIVGFLFATIEWFDGKNVGFIQACYSTNDGNVQFMLDECIKWAHSQNLRDLVFMTKRKPEAWNKKYNFNGIYTVMHRSI